MTVRDARGRYIKRQSQLHPTHWADGLAAKVRNTNPWVLFGWLALTAVIYAYVGKLVVICFLLWLALMGYLYLCRRFPRTMLFVTAFLSGLFGGRRYRGRW